MLNGMVIGNKILFVNKLYLSTQNWVIWLGLLSDDNGRIQNKTELSASVRRFVVKDWPENYFLIIPIFKASLFPCYDFVQFKSRKYHQAIH